MATSWTPAPCGVALRRDVNALFPNRDRRSDGVIGDTSHQARPSDHNPDRTWAKNLYVRAVDIDITPDGRDDLDLRTLLIKAAIKDKRTYYVISNGVIYSRTYGFAPRKYKGSNPHNGHVHVSFRGGVGDRSISIKTATALNNDTSSWNLIAAKPTPVAPPTRVSPSFREAVIREKQVIGILNTWELTAYQRQMFTQELKTLKDRVYHNSIGRDQWDALHEWFDARIKQEVKAGADDKARALRIHLDRMKHLRRNHPNRSIR